MADHVQVSGLKCRSLLHVLITTTYVHCMHACMHVRSSARMPPPQIKALQLLGHLTLPRILPSLWDPRAPHRLSQGSLQTQPSALLGCNLWLPLPFFVIELEFWRICIIWMLNLRVNFLIGLKKYKTIRLIWNKEKVIYMEASYIEIILLLTIIYHGLYVIIIGRRRRFCF